MPIDLTDRISLDAKDLRRTADGYMVANPRVARTGIQLYRGSEVGRPTLDVVRVYRPEEQVFAKDSMHTFAYKPITNNHPPVPVTADNWTKYAVGNSGGEVARDGEAVRVPMVVMDKAAIKEVEDGKSQLSVGYSTELVWGQGTSPQGETYDAMQTAIRVNHIAIVDAARGGDKLKLGDTVELFASLTNPADPAANVGDQHMAEVPQKTTTIVVDSISLEMSDTAAAVVNRSIKDLTDKLNSSVASVASITADAAKAKTEAEATIAKMTADHKVARRCADREGRCADQASHRQHAYSREARPVGQGSRGSVREGEGHPGRQAGGRWQVDCRCAAPGRVCATRRRGQGLHR
jgi:hypothetical protein